MDRWKYTYLHQGNWDKGLTQIHVFALLEFVEVFYIEIKAKQPNDNTARCIAVGIYRNTLKHQILTIKKHNRRVVSNMYFGLNLIMVDISIQTDVCAQTELFPLSYITSCCYKYKTLKTGPKPLSYKLEIDVNIDRSVCRKFRKFWFMQTN